MTSKVLVKLPGGPFAQVSAVKKSGSEVSVGASCGLSGVGFGGGAGNSVEAALRVSQLEQNLRFLQEQHQLMLAGLHREIDTLRQRNRDLQFQIIFAKESVSTSPAKADEESPKVKSVADKDTPRVQVAEKSEVVHSKPETQKPKAEGTREKEAPVKKQTEPDDPSQDERYAQLQREVESERARCRALEQELVTARTALEASQSQTTALQALLQHHKVVSGGSVSVVEAGAGAGRLQRRLEEAERLVVRLRAEASSQRREVRPSSHHQHHHAGVTNLLFEPAHAAAPVARNYLQSIKASLSAGGRSAVGGAGASGGGGGRGRQQQQQRFPPLQQTNSQTPPHYWQQTQQLELLERKWHRDSSLGSNVGALPSLAVCRLTALCSTAQRTKGSEYGGGGWVRGAGPPTTLPDLRNTNPPPYNNGNSGHSQSQSRKSGGGGGGGGYSNSQYSRGGERSYRPNYTSEEQRRTHNTPAELSDGEQEEQEPAQQPQEQAGPKGGHSYRNKRHNRQHHDNT